MNDSNLYALRRHDLDWIRVLAMFCLLFFHTGMLFVAEWDWHVQNTERSNIFLEWMFFMSGWRMSLLFIVSGAGTYFALRKRSNGQYVKERAKRLLIPLVFGMLFIVPPQIYTERLATGVIDPGFLAFWPSVLEFTPYPAGDFSWHHLWFIFYLFLFSVLALPVFRWIGNQGQGVLNRLSECNPVLLFMLFAGIYAVVFALFSIPFPGPQNLVDDWGRFCSYLVLFVYGYIWFTHKQIAERMFAIRHLALKLGMLTLVVINVMRWNNLEPAWEFDVAQIAFMILRGLSGFCWAVALLGYARAWLNRPSSFLNYANEAVYPFYIIHQTAIIIIGYQVIHVTDTIANKFFFTVIASFILTMTVYECLVRPWPWMRTLFGMKAKLEKHKNKPVMLN